MNFKAGNQIGSYILFSECGKGAYGSVFLAKNTITENITALKIVCLAGRSGERELKGLSKYQILSRHTDLLQIYHVEAGDGYFYYTMDAADNRNPDGKEYVPDTLANRIKESGRLAPDVVKQMVLDLMTDLHLLHSKGLFHRDIKPDNILWINGKATFGDIGLITDSNQTILAGTPGFIPAEVLAGTREFEAKDDFYALGKTIYCAVTGLPVNQYPQFPESGTLRNTGELIRLYNKLCTGERVENYQLKNQSRKKRCYIVALLCLVVIGIFTAGVFLRKADGTKETTVVPEKEKAINRKQHAALQTVKPYVPSKEMMQLLPRIRKYYQNLMSELYQELGKASQKITDADIANAEKYLEQHPGHHLNAYPRAMAVRLKQEETEKKFAEKHKHEPVLEYMGNFTDIEIHQSALKGNALFWAHSPEETQKKLATLYLRQYELEKYILKKHKKNSYPE